MANESLLGGANAMGNLGETDYAGNAASAVNTMFSEIPADTEVDAPEATTAAAPPAAAPTPNRTLPLSATQLALLDAISDVESGGSWN